MTKILLYTIPIISIVGAFLVFKIDSMDKDKRTLVLVTPVIVGIIMYMLVLILGRFFYNDISCDGGILLMMILSFIIFAFGIYINFINLIYRLVKKFIN